MFDLDRLEEFESDLRDLECSAPNDDSETYLSDALQAKAAARVRESSQNAITQASAMLDRSCDRIRQKPLRASA